MITRLVKPPSTRSALADNQGPLVIRETSRKADKERNVLSCQTQVVPDDPSSSTTLTWKATHPLFTRLSWKNGLLDDDGKHHHAP